LKNFDYSIVAASVWLTFAKFSDLKTFDYSNRRRCFSMFYNIAQTTAAATAAIIAYSRIGTTRPMGEPHAAQNFGW
jgi:hypothetical protein